MNAGILAVGTWIAALIVAGVAANIGFALRHRQKDGLAAVEQGLVDKNKLEGSFNQRRIR